MTAGTLADDRAQCLAAGMNEVITKPVDPADLYAALLRWLPAPTAAVPLPPLSAPLPAPPAGAAATATATTSIAAQATARWPAVAGLDPAVGLRMVGGQPAVYQRVLLRFVEFHGGDAARLRAAAAAGDHGEILRLSHSLKGAAGALGALALATQAARVEGLLLGGPGVASAPAAAPDSPAASNSSADSPAAGNPSADAPADAVQALATLFDTMLAALPAALAIDPGAA